MFSLASLDVDLLKKKRAIFSSLIFFPNDDSYVDGNLRILPHSSKFDLHNNKLSSPKNRWVSLGSLLHIEKPLSSPLAVVYVIKPSNPSVQRRKMKGDSGSPFLIPLDGWISP